MILEVQIQIFGVRERRRTRVKVFIFNKFQGAQILIFIYENWHEASFYNKEQAVTAYIICIASCSQLTG